MSVVHVVLAGGGTAGHIEPAMNLADALSARLPGVKVTALGTAQGLETTLVPARGYELALIPAVPLPRRVSADLASLPVRLRSAVKAVRGVLDRTGADVVVGFGGYVAMPAYFAARRRTPIVVHEANARAGLANRIGARFTPYVAETVAGSLPGARLVGLPLRASIALLDREARRAEARAYFGLDADRPTLLVSGGSQGARRLNELVHAAAPALTAEAQVLHVVGPRNADQMATEVPGHHTVAFVDRMDLAYAAADLMLCRAGAMTCAELAAVGLPGLYVPLPIGNGEQRLNAAPVVAAGGGVMVADADLTAERIVSETLSFLRQPGRLASASAAARAFGNPDAADRLVDLVNEALASAPAGTQQP